MDILLLRLRLLPTLQLLALHFLAVCQSLPQNQNELRLPGVEFGFIGVDPTSRSGAGKALHKVFL